MEYRDLLMWFLVAGMLTFILGVAVEDSDDGCGGRRD